MKTSCREKQRIVRALNDLGLSRKDFIIPKEVLVEIKRRDQIKRDARSAKIPVG